MRLSPVFHAVVAVLSLSSGCGDDAAPPSDVGRPQHGDALDAGATDASSEPDIDWEAVRRELVAWMQAQQAKPSPYDASMQRPHDGSFPEVDGGACQQALRDDMPRAPVNFGNWLQLLMDEPNARSSFFLRVEGYDDRGCVLAYAAQLGFEPQEWNEQVVLPQVTYEQVRALLDFDVVAYIDVGCPSDASGATCDEHCASLPVESCKGDPRCSTFHAEQFDAKLGCYREVEVGCGTSVQGCSEFVTYGRDSEGQCYQFSNGCQPNGFTESNEPCAIDRDGRRCP
ncbi:MAG: hypothetical protein QM778_22815 [Myxococcales bacterium]